MLEPSSWRVFALERKGSSHPVADFPTHDEAWRECRHRNNYSNGGLFCIKPIYSVAKMKIEKLDAFVTLVQELRAAQIEYFANRSQACRKRCTELAGQLRDYIAKCKRIYSASPNYKPQPEAKGFFDLVDYWLTKSDEYRQHKKAQDEDKLVLRERYKQCRDLQSKIDAVVEQYVKYQPSDK